MRKSPASGVPTAPQRTASGASSGSVAARSAASVRTGRTGFGSGRGPLGSASGTTLSSGPAAPAVAHQLAQIPPELAFGLAMSGPTPGTLESLQRETDAVDAALQTGVYVVWRRSGAKPTDGDCFRIGPASRCFCDHPMSEHALGLRSRVRCGHAGCPCPEFAFVPSAPEEIGEWWLSRRAGFDAASWRAKCRCAHVHTDHDAATRRCRVCRCSAFTAAYACAACDKSGDEHETVIETEMERRMAGRPVGVEFTPLHGAGPLQQALIGRDSVAALTTISGPPPLIDSTSADAVTVPPPPSHACAHCGRKFALPDVCQRHERVCRNVFRH